MKERPVLFSTAMVQAILEGRKTVTRRVTNMEDVNADPGQWEVHKVGELGAYVKPKYIGDYGAYFMSDNPNLINILPVKSPYGAPGDLLYVRETFAVGRATDFVHYKASRPSAVGALADRWKPSIHMPKKFARIWLRVKDVRVERLQDISDSDVRAEGCVGSPFGKEADVALFPVLWNSINDKRGYGWDTNPYVWVVEFEKVER